MSNRATQPDHRLLLVSAAAMTAAAATALYLAMTLAPPRSGPNCLTADCVTYPYTDIAAYMPTDYWWMYPAALLPLTLVVALVSLRDTIPPHRRTALWLAVLSAAAASIVLDLAYAIQLMVVQPSLARGESEALTLWSQYNPHGLFIALENLGYLLACLALLAVAWLFPGGGARSRALRWWSGTWGTIGVIGLPTLALTLRFDMEYQYEVLSLVATWIGLLVLGPLLITRQRRARRLATASVAPPRDEGGSVGRTTTSGASVGR